MALKPGLRVSQTQKLALTPALRQSIEILRLSSTELQDLVAVELEQNPLLELESDTAPRNQGSYQFAVDTVAEPVTLTAHLYQQINGMTADEPILQLALYLAADLDEQGLLSDEDAAIAENLAVDIKIVKQAITLLQSCEPVGIGARNLQECLDLQLIALNESADARRTLIENLSDFANADWARLRRKTGLHPTEIQRLSTILQSLNPNPAASFSPAPAVAIQPDIQVSALAEGGFSVEIIGSVMPSLKIDQQLFEASTTADPGSIDYLNANLTQAKSLMRAIAARSKTVLRVCQNIVEVQYGFFTNGHDYLVPQSQIEMAASLGVHPSTITRAIAGKYLICAFGTFPLKFFFTNSLNSLNSNSACSAYVVQQQVRKMINNKTSLEILSDKRIAALLSNSGVDIARRTVAKYRQCLNIPNSALRRRSKNVL
jgi:RNA polymerase sigma-54 factor